MKSPSGSRLLATGLLLALLAVGCTGAARNNRLVGVFANSPNGDPMLEISKSGETFQAAVTVMGRQAQYTLAPLDDASTKRFFQVSIPDSLVALCSARDGLFIFAANVGSDIGGHTMTTEYCMYSEATGWVDLHKK